MIEYLIFLLIFSIIPVTPTCLILLSILRKYYNRYNFKKTTYNFMYVLIYIINCWFWGTFLYICNDYIIEYENNLLNLFS